MQHTMQPTSVSLPIRHPEVHKNPEPHTSYTISDLHNDKDFWDCLRRYSSDVDCRYYYQLCKEVTTLALKHHFPISIPNGETATECEIAMAAPAPYNASTLRQPQVRLNPFVFTPKDLLIENTFWDDMEAYAREDDIDFEPLQMLCILCQYVDIHDVDVFVYLPYHGI